MKKFFLSGNYDDSEDGFFFRLWLFEESFLSFSLASHFRNRPTFFQFVVFLLIIRNKWSVSLRVYAFSKKGSEPIFGPKIFIKQSRRKHSSLRAERSKLQIIRVRSFRGSFFERVLKYLACIPISTYLRALWLRAFFDFLIAILWHKWTRDRYVSSSLLIYVLTTK